MPVHACPEARRAGVDQVRLDVLSAWRESPLFSARERAALAWTEAITRLADTGAPDADHDEMAHHFSERERVHLTLLIGAINVWNRLAVGFRSQHPTAQAANAA